MLNLEQTTHPKPQTTNPTPHKPRLAFKGFTLSELLVSLAVLGLIAGLTVPSIVNAVQVSRTKAVLKETFQIVSLLAQDFVMNGDASSITSYSPTATGAGTIADYISSKLSITKQCLSTDLTSDGCNKNGGWPGNTFDSFWNIQSTRWILPNGAKIQGYAPPYGFYSNYWAIFITADGYKDGSSFTKDVMRVSCNILDYPVSFISSRTLNPGQCEVNPGYGDTLILQ